MKDSVQRRPRVILIAGPAAAGKTSTAARIAQHPQWDQVSEDHYWGEIKRGRPAGELRTAQEQAVVQHRVLLRLTALIQQQRNVALEFILYEAPPTPLTNYHRALSVNEISFETRLLRPNVDEVMRRMQARGRPTDSDIDKRRLEVEYQIKCLTPPHVDAGWIIDTSDMSLEEVYSTHFQRLVEG
jgi:adenylate kinase family enzyme